MDDGEIRGMKGWFGCLQKESEPETKQRAGNKIK